VGETRSQLDGLAKTAETGLGQLVDTAGGQVDATVGQGRTLAAGEVDKLSGSISTNLGQIRQSVDKNVADATTGLAGGAKDGRRPRRRDVGFAPGAMREAADAQEGSWLSRLGGWFSDQLSDAWKAVKGMCDWRFGREPARRHRRGDRGRDQARRC
jgi:hypothetical protein